MGKQSEWERAVEDAFIALEDATAPDVMGKREALEKLQEFKDDLQVRIDALRSEVDAEDEERGADDDDG